MILLTLQFSGEICREFTHQRYNPKVSAYKHAYNTHITHIMLLLGEQARRYDQVRRDVWATTPGWFDSGDRIYSAGNPIMQVYAAHTHRRAYVQAVKLASLQRAVPLNMAQHMLAGSRELDPFAMPGWSVC